MIYVLTAGIIVLLGLFFFLRPKPPKPALFRALGAADNFRFIEQGNYVLKSNRFSDIMCADFLSGCVDSVFIEYGVTKYNVDENVLFAPCRVVMPASGRKKSFAIDCVALLHLRKTPVSFSLKISRTNKKKITSLSTPLANVISEPEDFTGSFALSCSQPQVSNLDIKSLLKDINGRYPFLSPVDCGVTVISDKGWLIIAKTTSKKAMLRSFLELDKLFSSYFIKKNA